MSFVPSLYSFFRWANFCTRSLTTALSSGEEVRVQAVRLQSPGLEIHSDLLLYDPFPDHAVPHVLLMCCYFCHIFLFECITLNYTHFLHTVIPRDSLASDLFKPGTCCILMRKKCFSTRCLLRTRCACSDLFESRRRPARASASSHRRLLTTHQFWHWSQVPAQMNDDTEVPLYLLSLPGLFWRLLVILFTFVYPEANTILGLS